MAFLWRAIKAQFLWTQLSHYKAVKEQTVKQFPRAKKSLKEKPAGGKFHALYAAMQTEGTPENFAWIGCKGFTGGIILSWTVFLFCIVGLRISLERATWLSASLATLLSFGLAFSSIIRCYVLMLLPQLFSKRGRQALAAYAFLLALGGPARNSLHNLGVLSSSLACGQEQVKRCMRQVVEMVREPLRALTATLKRLVKDIGRVVQPIRDAVMRLTRVFAAVFGVIASVTSWLSNIVSVCNKKTGTPYQRCVRSLDDAIADCQVKLGVMQFLCSVVSAVKHLCLTVKVVDALCGVMDIISDAVVGAAKRSKVSNPMSASLLSPFNQFSKRSPQQTLMSGSNQEFSGFSETYATAKGLLRNRIELAAFRQHVVDMLYVSIEMEHSVDMNTTASRSMESVVTAIVDEVESRTQTARALLGWAPVLPGLAFVLLILKVFLYRHKFLTSDKYDNRYIGRRIVELDLLRIRRGLPTALPLELRERSSYTPVACLRLVRGERRRLVSAFFFLALTTVQIGSYFLCDYGIYWTLALIRQQGLDSAVSAQLPTTGVQVEGQGALSSLYRELGGALQPPPPKLDLDPIPCLPEPSPPDNGRYMQIGFLVAASWLLALTEPYGLRLRHVVMSHYYPARAQKRAVWLHNHILIARGSFMTFAREKLRRRLRRSSAGGGQPVSLWQRLVHRNAVLQRVFGGNVAACVVCAARERKRGSQALKECPAPDCTARFCYSCLPSLRHCILCYEPMHHGELGDISEARDSSDESPHENWPSEFEMIIEEESNRSENEYWTPNGSSWDQENMEYELPYHGYAEYNEESREESYEDDTE